jgi:hypothetical protein
MSNGEKFCLHQHSLAFPCCLGGRLCRRRRPVPHPDAMLLRVLGQGFLLGRHVGPQLVDDLDNENEKKMKL